MCKISIGTCPVLVRVPARTQSTVLGLRELSATFGANRPWWPATNTLPPATTDARDGKLSVEQADQDFQNRLPQLQVATLQRLLAQTKAGAYQ